MGKLFFLLTIFIQTFEINSATQFPAKGSIEARVEFWKRVYTEISSREAFLHDEKDLSIVYDSFDIPPGIRAQKQFYKRTRRLYAKIIRSLAKKKEHHLKPEEKQFKKRYSHVLNGKSEREMLRMARNLRFQGGLKDRYYSGLIRSYKYLPFIEKVMREEGVPKELKYLPHVESSFNYQAYSKVGAAGIWQFMRRTGRQYKLKINYAIDERRDVIKATRAAAKLLKDNYRVLKSWPLALIAYNHGAYAMKKAIRKMGTKEVHKIIDGHKGRNFGFASKNFYPTFLAAVEISKNPQDYFPSFKKPQSFKFSQFKLPKTLRISDVAQSLGVKQKTIQNYNYAIRKSAFKNDLPLPKGFNLVIPQTHEKKLIEFIAKLRKTKPSSRDSYILHKVSRGENLWSLSKQYNIPLKNLLSFNHNFNPNKIYPGMEVKIPAGDAPIPLNKKFHSHKKARVHQKPVQEPSPIKRESLNHIELTKYHLNLTKIDENNYQIKIENNETLGHLAEWSRSPITDLKRLNNSTATSRLQANQKFKIKIKSDKDRINFINKRMLFHKAIQEDFYENFEVEKIVSYKVRKGDSLVSILNQFSLPFWLFRKHQNQELNHQTLQINQEILIPKIQVKKP